ncbi:hypothetical protein LZ32DRAFT_660903 [Colletotrichum eremochloae]|nr:hypothetical protein LZ32DRAFT_660903 [Colletotrichum eremochloae]
MKFSSASAAAIMVAVSLVQAAPLSASSSTLAKRDEAADRKLKVRLNPEEAASLRDANRGNGLSPAENAAIAKQDEEAAGPPLSD